MELSMSLGHSAVGPEPPTPTTSITTDTNLTTLTMNPTSSSTTTTLTHNHTHTHPHTPTHPLNKHSYFSSDCVLGAVRGWRNGIITGVRIRLPYIFQAVIFALLFGRSSEGPQLFSRVLFVIKQMFHHGRNLGLFVLIYKTICCAMRNVGVSNGIDSWVAGLIGGYFAFGDSNGVSGSVNNQIVLYLFARGIEGSLKTFAQKGYLPKQLDVSSPQGFRYLAGFSLALILYLTEYQPQSLKSNFYSTMDFIYYHSDRGPVLPPLKFAPVVFIVLISFLAKWNPKFSLENLLQLLLREKKV